MTPGPPGVGDDGEAVAEGQALHRERLRAVEQLADLVDPHHPGALEGGIEDRVVARHASGVRERRLGPPVVLPALSTMIGFVRANARAALRNRRASVSDSM